MKKFLTMLSLVLLGFASTSCYDDSKLWESVENLDARVETLETLCTQMNSNLTALTELINVMTMGDVIIGVTPVKENGVEIGWQILLKDGGIVTIYHGKDGADGKDGDDGKDGANGTNGTNGNDGAPGKDADAPVFGVKLENGIYYWTLDGKFVIDAEGNKVPVSGPAGTDGTNGVTPKLKIENNTWYVSYDGEKTWEEVGAAVAVGIKSIETVDGNLVISMADGNNISIPLGSSLKVVLGEFDATALQYGADLEIPYTIEGAEGEVVVFLLKEGSAFEAELVEESALAGKVVVKQLAAAQTEAKGKIGIFASAEDGTTVSQAVRLTSGVFYSVEGNKEAYEVEAAGGIVEFKVATNTAFEVKIEERCDWITFVPQTKAVEEVALSFEVAANTGEDREATVEVVSGDVKLSFTVTQKGGFTFEETLVGAYKIKKIWVYGGTGPQYGGAGWYPIFEKTWFFDQTTGHGIGAELDNYFEFTFTEYDDATKQSTGECVNWAGKDGKNWDCWFHDNKNNAGEYRIADGAKDVNNFYRQIPIGTSTWVRDYNVTPNTVTFTDADGKQTVLKLYEASSPFEFVPGYDDKNATANTRYFPGTYKAGESPAAGMDVTFHATVKGTDFWGGEDKEYTSVERELDKMYYNPREVIFDVEKFDSVPEESKNTEGKVTPVIPERPQPEEPEAPATTLAGTYKYSTDFTVGGKDGAITVKGLTDQYATWEPAASKVKLIKNDLYTFTPNGTDANGNETGTVTFDDGGDGTWDFSVYDNTNNNKMYDATELYCFIAQDNTSTYVYDATAGTITFTTRGEELVVDYLVPGTYKYSTKDVTVPTSSTFGMHYDMGYTEARIPGYSNTTNGCARHYVWARDWVLCLVKQ